MLYPLEYGLLRHPSKKINNRSGLLYILYNKKEVLKRKKTTRIQITIIIVQIIMVKT